MLKAYPKLFVRNKGVLIINVYNGKSIHLNDTKPSQDLLNNDDVIEYAIVNYFSDINYALVAAQYWEGGTYYLLNMKTGEQIEIGGYAVLSPDKSKIAVSELDLDAGYRNNVLAVYRISQNGIIKEFLENPEDWGAENVVWNTNHSIKFSKHFYHDGSIQAEQKTLRFHNGTWKIE